MADADFTFPVRAAPSGQVDQRILRADFGDGYSQRAGDGINAALNRWTVSFRSTWLGECVGTYGVKDVRDFLVARGGWQSFRWTPPGGVQGFYTAVGFGITPEGNSVFTLTATFEEVFYP